MSRPAFGVLLAGLLLLGACVPVTFETEPVLNVWWAIFYSVSVTTIIAFYLINIALKNVPGLYYSTLFAFFLLMIFALEGGLKLFGLEGRTEASLVLTFGLLNAGFGYFTAGSAIDPGQSMVWTRRLVSWLTVLCALLVPVVWVWPTLVMRGLIIALTVGMFASHYISTRTWVTHDAKPQKMPVVATTVLLLCGAVFVWLFVSGIGNRILAAIPVYRIIFAMITAPTMAAVVAALIDMRRARDTAMKESLEAARRDAETNKTLLEMEKNYARARDVAARRTKELSTASHDIRQPIASMRSELDALRAEAPSEVLDRLGRVLDHMDSLTGELSQSARRPDEAGLHGEMAQEVLPVSLLFDTLDRMFGAEAREKGIELTFVRSGKSVVAPPLALIRLVGNLISNALTHAEPSKVLVGIRPRGGRLRLEVIDNGRGFEGGTADWAFASGRKSDTSPGAGLGLSIVHDLSSEYHMPVEAVTREGAGSLVSVWLSKA